MERLPPETKIKRKHKTDHLDGKIPTPLSLDEITSSEDHVIPLIIDNASDFPNEVQEGKAESESGDIVNKTEFILPNDAISNLPEVAEMWKNGIVEQISVNQPKSSPVELAPTMSLVNSGPIQTQSIPEASTLYPIGELVDCLVPTVDPCEEALTVFGTAPFPFESGDFYSLPTLPKVLELETVEEEVDVFKKDAQPSLTTQIKSLYNNYLLENNATYVKQFLDSLQPSCNGFELFELLSNYLRACNQLTGSEKSLTALKENCDEAEKRVWLLSVTHLTETTQCEDGTTLTANYDVHKAEYNLQAVTQLGRALKDIKELFRNSFSLHTYSVILSKTQIEHFMFKSFANFNLESFHIQSYSPGYPSQDVRGFAALLRRTLTVLFHFLRKPQLQSAFQLDCREWARRCAGLLLRIATIEDHHFLLNHVLRLPPRSISKFGAALVQIPPIPIPSNPSEYSASFTHLHLDYALNFLATILSPVERRCELLSAHGLSTKHQSAFEDKSLQWVIVDSDGEDDVEEAPFFKEADLIALLHQVPFDKLFRRILLVYTDEAGKDVLNLCTEHSVLKLIAFGSQLINIFGNGLATYYTDRYRQLVKLLGRLILHTMQYVTDQAEIFIQAGGRNYGGFSPVFREYDTFVYTGVQVLLMGKNVGTSQFLSAVPFHLISTNMLWEVYGIITKWDPKQSLDISNEFQNELLSMSEANSFYILTSMSNIALARTGGENQFIKTVTFHLFQIGFVRPLLRDIFSKNVRDLLGSLSLRPRVISYLLQNIKQSIDVLDKMGLFIVRELIFDTWKPTSEDLNLLAQWLVHFQSFAAENQLARFVLQSMNWDYAEDDELFLPRALQVKVALVVVESHFKWEKPQNVLSEGMKQLSAYVARNPDFTSWAWDILKRLHLHGFDRHRNSEPSMSVVMAELLSFDSHAELGGLQKALKDKNPIACTVALLLTPLGHSLPLICSQGFELLEVLLSYSKFDVVIRLLFFIVPLFASARESIINCYKFRKILITLLAADMTYVRMAKSLLLAEFPGKFTKLFGEMVHTQLQQSSRFKTKSRRLTRLWLELLTKIQGWNKDNNILHLLDVIGRFAYVDEDCRKIYSEFFTVIYKEIPVQNSSGIGSFLFNWSYSATTVLPNASYAGTSYLTYFILSIESFLEMESGFWTSLTTSLSNPKITLDSAVRKACSSSKYSTTSNYLTIYRWAQHALDLPLNHPMLLVFWQKFFVKFFQRCNRIENSGGIGERFFEGIINTGFQKKLKRRIHELVQFFSDQLNKLENTTGEETQEANQSYIIQHLNKCQSLANGMALWIDEAMFHQESLYIPALPPQCLPVQLHTLVEGDMNDWIDYIDMDQIKGEQKSSQQCYQSAVLRHCWTHPKKLSKWNYSGFQEDELLKRLDSYDTPLEPPPVPTFHQIIPAAGSSMYVDSNVMAAEIRLHLKYLLDFAAQFSVHVSKHTALDCSYLESLPDLYTFNDSEALVNVQCSSGKRSFCSGPGHVIFKFNEARLNERVGHIVHQNRLEYHNLLSENLIKPPPEMISVGAAFIEDFITNLILFHRNVATEALDRSKVQRCGVELFYLVAARMNEESGFYPPTRQLFSSFLEVLGHEFIEIEPEQCVQLVSSCIGNPQLVGALTPHMNLLNTSPESLLAIYKQVVPILERNGDLAFVILSKVELNKWLNKRRPKLFERCKLITVIWGALISDETLSSDEATKTKPNGMAYGKLRSHLKTLLLYDFPQHYGEILNLLLEDSDKGVVPIELWYDFINGLSQGSVCFIPKMDVFQRKREMRRFAVEIDILRHQELLETISLLGNHFKKDRLANGIYGLYPKYRYYVEPISCFLQLISSSLISSSLKSSKGIPTLQIAEILWPLIRDLYIPWILPFDQRIVQQESANWIQQMNFDSTSILQPWIASDSVFAALFMNDFTDSVLFLAEALPGCPFLFSSLWLFYAENYSSPNVKEHVLGIVNHCYISIPWSTFWPTLPDMESMNKVVENYLPACHSLLAVIFAQINWTDWTTALNSFGTSESARSRSYSILLNLTVHLATDIVARESPTWNNVMQYVQNLNWEYIHSNSLESTLNWFVMSVDPRIVLLMENNHRIDEASFQLIRIASGYGRVPSGNGGSRRQLSNQMKANLNRKRYFFVRTYVRLLVSASTMYKTLLQTRSNNFEKAVENILQDITCLAREEQQQISDFSPHLKEVIGLISNHYLGTLGRNGAILWLETNSHQPLPLVYELIKIGTSMKVPAYIIVPLLEKALPLVFQHSDGNWKGIRNVVIIPEFTDQSHYLDVASKDGHFLAVYAVILTRISFYKHGSLRSVSSLSEILKNMKPKESNEAVLPLLYGFFIRISVYLLKEGAKHLGEHLEKAVKRYLSALTLHLTTVGEDRQGWLLLGVLGLTKASALTLRGRLFCRCLSAFVMAQLPVNGPVRLEVGADEPVANYKNIKPHAEFEGSMQKLEDLKMNPLYSSEHMECIESAISFIRDQSKTLSSTSEFIRLLVCQLFVEPYVLAPIDED